RSSHPARAPVCRARSHRALRRCRAGGRQAPPQLRAALSRLVRLCAAGDLLTGKPDAALLAGEVDVCRLARHGAAGLAGAAPGVVRIRPGDAGAAVGAHREPEVVEECPIVTPVERGGREAAEDPRRADVTEVDGMAGDVALRPRLAAVERL